MGSIFETQFAGLKLSNPIVASSSGLTDTVKKNKELDKAGVGAIVLKSLFEEQISKEAEILLKNSSYPEANDYILNYTREDAVNNYLKLITESKDACRVPIIASINCYNDSSWIDFARQIEIAGADALEVNILALNTNITDECESLEDIHLRIAKKLTEVINIPVVIKLSKYFSNLVKLVNNLTISGASGVVLFNRFYQNDIDLNNLQMTSGQVFSSHTAIADTLRWTGVISGKLPNVSIAASTGVHDWEGIVKCILSGASAVQLCSTLYQNGNDIIPQMKSNIEEWLQASNFSSISEIKGKLNYAGNASLYERIQFMKYFSNRD
ncbi:dihydroorotate dehydrogenase (fumarate) [Dysgonomonadaceae bacterium PH5-43]|nr:dihydroorotate dehydrogenase (fumarate) [Dysgonomonadaceae bacterium PH5-43]